MANTTTRYGREGSGGHIKKFGTKMDERRDEEMEKEVRDKHMKRERERERVSESQIVRTRKEKRK